MSKELVPCVPILNWSMKAFSLVLVLIIIPIALRFCYRKKHIPNRWVFLSGMSLLVSTIIILSVNPFLYPFNCGLYVGGKTLHGWLFSISAAACAIQNGALLSLCYKRLELTFGNAKLSQFKLKKCTKCFFLFMNISYWTLCIIGFISVFVVQQFNSKLYYTVVFILSLSVGPLYLILLISTSCLFIYKMREFIISVNNDTALFRVTWRFAVLFSISFTTTFIHFILIVVQIDSTNKVEAKWRFYLRLYLWILDVFTNAVCTVMTYNGFEKGYEVLCGKCCAYKTGWCFCSPNKYIKCSHCWSVSHKLAFQAKKYIPDNNNNQTNSHGQIQGEVKV